MAIESKGFSHTFTASTGLRQYQVVDLNSAGVLISPSSAGANCVGVLCSSGTTGSTGRAGSTHSGSVQEVQYLGIAKVLAGSTAIAIGDAVMADTDGRAIAGTTNAPFGISLSAVDSTSTSAHVISVLLQQSLV